MVFGCRKGSGVCFCGGNAARELINTSPEENALFYDVKRVLNPPAIEKLYPFYFHLLDGFRDCAVSLGLDPNFVLDPAAADAFEKSISSQAETMRAQTAGHIDVVHLLETIDPLARNCNELLRSARSYVGLRGQPLGNATSWLEKCLAIKSAGKSNLEKLSRPEREISKKAYFAIDDYLGGGCELNDIYGKLFNPEEHAFGIGAPQGAESSITQVSASICTPQTAPFLAAEHIELLARARMNDSTLGYERLSELKPGIVIFPFKVLGQYRGAAVWFYFGSFKKDPRNGILQRHLKALEKTTGDWLALSAGQIVLHVHHIQISRALNNIQEARNSALVNCAWIQRAFSGLWFSQDLKIEHNAKHETICLSRAAEAIVTKLDQRRRFSLRIFEPRIASLLGFESIHYNCPFMPAEGNSAEISSVSRTFTDVNEAFLSEYQRARRREQSWVREQFEFTAHDYKNAMNELSFILDTGGIREDPLNIEVRLKVARSIVSHLRGHAWIARAVHRFDEVIASSILQDYSLLSDLKFVATDPSRAELDAWKANIYWQAILSAYAMKSLHQSSPERSAGAIKLNYTFSFSGRHDDEAWSDGPRETLIDSDTVRKCVAAGIHLIRPSWPLKLDETEGSKLDDLGRQSVMLVGATELLRNACKMTARMARAGEGQVISVSADIHREDSSWVLRIIVDNPTSVVPAPVDQFLWYNRIRKVLKIVRFEDVPALPGRVAYAFRLEVPDGDS